MYNPKYYVSIVTDAEKYDVTNALTSLTLIENDGEIAQRINFSLVNAKVNGKKLSSIFNVRDKVYVYAKTDGKKTEVFRGYIWNDIDDEAEQRELSFVAYDKLIYLQKSQDYVFIESGKSTKAIAKQLCKDWGIELSYEYSSISHGKLALRGYLSDIFLEDLINEVKKKTGKKGVMKSIKGKAYIQNVGANSEIYTLKTGDGGTTTRTRKERQMPEVTKIVIMGIESDSQRSDVKKVLTKNTKKFGTLQMIETVSSDTDIDKVTKEANETLKEKGVVKTLFTYEGIDIPFIRKGDKVKIKSNNLNNSFIVKSISHDAMDKKMSMEMEKA